ncbi:hypothetical protein EI94DRAFT_1787777 [Lactarius quietus]|nr:hypothetical protein EI94DRAFT_1787777 [Lactarius quietus]
MLFQRSLISFAATMALAALASSVAASAILGQRAVTCSPDTGSLLCCNSASNFTQLPSDEQDLIIALDSNVNITQIVGTQCNVPESSDGLQWYCTPRVPYSIRWLTGRSSTNALCCNGAFLNQNGLNRVADNCVGPTV